MPKKQIQGIVGTGKNNVELNWSPNGRFLSNSNEKEALIIENVRDPKSPDSEPKYRKIGEIKNDLFIQNRRRVIKSSIAIMNDKYFVISYNIRSNSTTEESKLITAFYIFSLELRSFISKISNGKTSANLEVIVNGLAFHPKSSTIFVSVDTEGQVIFWDLIKGSAQRIFFENGMHIRHHLTPAAVWDCSFSKDGQRLIVSTGFGSFSVYGYGSNPVSEHVNSQQFSSEDFKPIQLIPDNMTILNDNGEPWFPNDEGFNCNLHGTENTPFPLNGTYEDQQAWLKEEFSKNKENRRELQENANLCKMEEDRVLFNERRREKANLKKGEDHLIEIAKIIRRGDPEPQQITNTNATGNSQAQRRGPGRPRGTTNGAAGQAAYLGDNNSFISYDNDSNDDNRRLNSDEEDDFTMDNASQVSSEQFEFDNTDEDDDDVDTDSDDSTVPNRVSNRLRNRNSRRRRNRTPQRRVHIFC